MRGCVALALQRCPALRVRHRLQLWQQRQLPLPTMLLCPHSRSLWRQGVELNAARLRMAHLPCDSQVEVLFTPGLWVPLVNCHGVYILPGIPR